MSHSVLLRESWDFGCMSLGSNPLYTLKVSNVCSFSLMLLSVAVLAWLMSTAVQYYLEGSKLPSLNFWDYQSS